MLKDELGQTYIYICILSGRKNVINMLSYLYVSCVTRINLDKHTYVCILVGRKNVINMLSYLYVSCYKDKLGQTYIYIYICILSGSKICDKYAIIFTCKLCYKDKLGQTYVYICILSGMEKCDFTYIYV